MRILAICKRRSSHRDLIADRHGRYFHLLSELGALGHETLAFAADYQLRGLPEIDVGQARFVSCHVSELMFASLPGRLRKSATEFSPDVVFAGGDTHLGWFGQRVARSMDIPFVFDVFDNYETFQSARIPGMRRKFHDVSTSADLTVVVSSGLETLLKPARNVRIIPNGVDMEVFRPAAHQKRSEGHLGQTVGYVGGITRDRGIETLVQAISQLRAHGREIELALAGPIGGAFQIPPEPWIEYRGVLPYTQVAEFVRSLDVAVLPYPDTAWARYTSPYKLHEYLACEVPVVVTDVSDYRADFGISEATCSPGDPTDMARAISFQLDAGLILERQDSWSWASRAKDLFVALEAATQEYASP